MAEQKIVGVKFEGSFGGKIYYFNPQNFEYKNGDKVVVETSHGYSVGEIAIPNRMVDEKELVEPLKNVVRKCNQNDLKTLERLKNKEQNALICAKKLSEKLKLNMQIADSEYTFDESKVIISFTADDRVDFRELVKQLAGELKTRIELRQVGIRDKAKLLGGIGPCGREVCCKRFLRDFEKVNIKMAKNQGISLNPTNINGLCGRLMCCLTYENDHYVELIKIMPKINSTVKTKDGIGTVVYNDLLKKMVSVKIYSNEKDFDINDYALDEIEKLDEKTGKNND